MSEQQLAGGADTATAFIKGKLEGLKQQYARGDDQRGQYFDSKMLTAGARDLFGKSSSSSGAPSAPKPGDVQQGYRFKGGDPANPANWDKVP
jgi:hypothetical protein